MRINENVCKQMKLGKKLLRPQFVQIPRVLRVFVK